MFFILHAFSVFVFMTGNDLLGWKSSSIGGGSHNTTWFMACWAKRGSMASLIFLYSETASW